MGSGGAGRGCVGRCDYDLSRCFLEDMAHRIHAEDTFSQEECPSPGSKRSLKIADGRSEDGSSVSFSVSGVYLAARTRSLSLFGAEASDRFELKATVLIWSRSVFPKSSSSALTRNVVASLRIASSVGCEVPAS